MKTNELTGAALDWAVANCEKHTSRHTVDVFDFNDYFYNPSTDWAIGGPIIEREGIGVYQYRGAWAAHCVLPNGGLHACMENQPTPLIAAMRCYVASKMGDNIDIPEELC